jgi:hypothetical protein
VKYDEKLAFVGFGIVEGFEYFSKMYADGSWTSHSENW